MDEEDHELVFVDTAKKRRARIHRCAGYLGVAGVAFLVLALIGLVVALAVVATRQDNGSGVAPTSPPTEPCPKFVCRTKSCSELSVTISANLDTTVDPCQDFYSFSCRGWVKENPVPEGLGRYSQFNQLDERNKRALIEILEGTYDDDIEAVRKLKDLYELCLNVKRLDKLGAEPLIALITKLGGWPLVRESGSGSGAGSGGSDSGSGFTPFPPFLNSDYFLLMKLYGSPAFFNFYVYVDDKNSSQYTIFLEQSGLTLPSPTNYNNTDSSGVITAFREYAVGILSHINPNISRDVYESAVNRIIELEKKLAKIFVPAVDLRNPEATYNKTTLGNLSKWFPGSFDWGHVLNHSFILVDVPHLADDEAVVVRTYSYFKEINHVLSDTDHETLYNYMMWQYIKGFIPYLSQDFLDVYYNFTEAVTGSGERDRNETCLALVQDVMPIALARPYTEYILPGGVKEDVEAMISEVKTAFKQRVSNNTWLDKSTKEKCYEKVGNISQRVAYPELVYHDSYIDGLYENYSVGVYRLLLDMASIALQVAARNLGRLHSEVDKTEWDIAPTAVNAYYNPSFNQFTFLEGILAPPFIRTGWPHYFTYGAFGVVIGHELTHGFDDQGQQYDEHGNLRPWWDKTSTQQFKDRQKCFVEQYSKYEIFGQHVNGNLTLGENLADNGGLKTSYQAYRNVAAKEGMPSYLPGLKYTPDQLFFIAFAQVWCSNFTREYITTALLTDPHSPGPFRVKGALVNSQEFADTFQCAKGSPMNPKNKCLMW